jgi:MFS family permease
MTTLIIARNHYLEETSIGKVKKQNSEKLTLHSIKKPYKEAFAYLRENKTAKLVVLANILFYVYLIIGTNQSVYFAPYLVEVLGMSVYQSSILGSIYSIGMLISMTVIIPKISPIKIHRGNVVASFITILGLVFLVIIPSGSFVMSIISIFILSIGYGMIRPMIDTALAVSTEGDSRSGIYSIINAVSSIAGMVAAIAISFLYAWFKKSIFYISIVILFFLAVLFHNAFKNERKRNVI